ncbi:hypothetical protein UABAM_06208 [Candidatus Uabimicrobium amorphum]|uniref:Uncharacterized protein n=1 Tax=Uabimicrobium amorphum TaxID=2596890 RepID=A0A5S9ITD2_UABAM|nr:hypothetical protein UABAM_06208 [Candidatus Uabimicrobium amorphum]
MEVLNLYLNQFKNKDLTKKRPHTKNQKHQLRRITPLPVGEA